MTNYQRILACRTDKELLRDWTVLDAQIVTPNIATIREWIMREIEKRFPTEFDNWLENCATDDNIAHYIILK